MIVALFTRPSHDITTQYLYYYNQKAVTLAKKTLRQKGNGVKAIWQSILGFFGLNTNVIDLKKTKANRLDFSHKMKTNLPELVFLNGHGAAGSVTGDQNRPLVDSSNAHILKDKVAYAFSCQSAKTLGPKAVAAGAQAYLGYDEDFVFLVDEAGKPKSDQTAGTFMQPAMEISHKLIEGQSPQEAWQESQNAFENQISRLSASEVSEQDRQMLPYLVWDRDHQVCLEATS